MPAFAETAKGKRVTLMGLGLLGRGVGDAEFLARAGADLTVTDMKTEAELADSVARLRRYPNVRFRLGGHRKEDFTGADMVIKASGVPLDSPYIAAARAARVPIYMSTALFAKFAMEMGAKIVGVTGTRGKTTVAHMIFHVLKQAGRKAYLGGNVRGVSTLAMLPDIRSGDIAVLELDSWQLQGFGDLKISPNISVFTNMMSDHQNYYPDMETYFADKANIFCYQKSGDTLIVGASVLEWLLKILPPVRPVVPEKELGTLLNLRVIGEHNKENAAFAATALIPLGLSDSEIKNGLESFEPVEGRLQLAREIGGVKIYNDNNATTPEATIAALRALGNAKERNVVLIVGGDDKQLDMSKLVNEIPKWCSRVVMFKERGTDRIRDRIFALKQQGIDVYEEEGLEATVKRAFSIAKKYETILYSPAFSSFGKYFKNEFDRNDQFVSLVRKLS